MTDYTVVLTDKKSEVVFMCLVLMLRTPSKRGVKGPKHFFLIVRTLGYK